VTDYLCTWFFFRNKLTEEILVLFVNYKLCISDVFACYFLPLFETVFACMIVINL